jgi:class 3 adenylate cyclase/tetratricopeptide (TPR) repeat protein
MVISATERDCSLHAIAMAVPRQARWAIEFARMICNQCRTANPDTASFCLSCGVRLRPAAPRGLAERRLMHVVFCDLVGSTPLSEQLDPEDLRSLLQHFQSICAEIVARFEGYVAQFLGDGALIYFGYPQAHEDDALRAVRAGLQIARAVSANPVAGHRVAVRVGIHSGLVVVGEVGIPGHRAELAVGETPTVAERVQAEAEPGTVVMTEATARLVRGFFIAEELGPRTLRGRSQSLTLFKVVSESGARNRLEATQATGLTPLVARADEMAAVLRSWDAARAGHGRVVSIQGEAGVGKSRLVNAFKVKLEGEPFDVIQGSCFEYLRTSAFHPFAAALEQQVQRSPAQRSGLIEHCAERFGLTASQTSRVLSDLLRIPVDRAYIEEKETEPSAGRLRQLTMEALSSWLLNPEGGSPKLLVVEDLHWADASTIELIETVSERLATRPVLMLLTFRSEFHPPGALADRSAMVALGPLGRSDATRIAASVAGGTLPDELSDRLEEWTKGVPLYIEEFTKGLLESGALTVKAGRGEMAGPLRKSLMPETLAGPLTARIDRLAAAKPVAQLAAVLGSEFRYDLLAAVSGLTPPDFRGAVGQLVASEIFVGGTDSAGAVLHFRHALLRDAAFNSLLLADRRAIHGRIVECLRSGFEDFADKRPEIVAHHASQAGLSAIAAAEWQRATERALSRAANWEALSHIDEGVRQLEQLPEDKERYERQLAFELTRGPALMAVRGYQAAQVKETYRRALSLCERLGDPSRLYPVLWGLWANQFVAGELVAAKEFGEQVFELASGVGNAALRVPAYHALAYTLCYTGEFKRALELARAGLALFDMELERRNVLAFQFSSTVALHQTASVSLWMLGFPDQARNHAREAIDLAVALANAPTLAYAHSSLTWGAPFLLGDLEALDTAALKATELSKDEKFSLWPTLVQVFRGWSAAASGASDVGLAQMLEGYSTFRGIGGGILRTTMRALIAQVKSNTGDQAGALETLSSALSDIASTQEHTYEPEVHRVRGEVLASMASGPLRSEAEAEASFRSALLLAREQGARSLELRAAVSLAAFLRERERAEEGRSIVREVYDTFTEGFETPDLRAARLAMR